MIYYQIAVRDSGQMISEYFQDGVSAQRPALELTSDIVTSVAMQRGIQRI